MAAGEELPGISRKDKLDALAAGAGASDALDVFVNTYSLEPDLVAAGNADLLKKVYLALHPKSEANWDTAINKSGDEQACAIQELFGTTRKGSFAHILADLIAAGEQFTVPAYIKRAIEALVQ